MRYLFAILVFAACSAHAQSNAFSFTARPSIPFPVA